MSLTRRGFVMTSVAATVAATLAERHALAAPPPPSGSAVPPIAADVPAVTGEGTAVTLSKTDLQALRSSLRGPLILPDQPGYEEARRVQNRSIDKRPALVIQPSGAADVRTAVQFARAHSLLLAVKCGGHSYGGKGTCDGGMQLDLSRMRGVRVDPANRVAYVSGGSLLGDLDHETMAAGLVTTAGTVSHTGVGGLTLGAGFGRLARRFGLALDNVRAVDIVTADGKLLRASALENPDLYWAVRGGGGNFGVVTAFEFGLHPMERTVIGGSAVYPFERARELFKFYAEYGLAAPDELYVDTWIAAPAKDGPKSCGFQVCYAGPPAGAERALAPLRKFGKPVADTIGPIDYVKLQRSGDRTDPRNEGQYLKSGFLDTFPGTLADAIVDNFQPDPVRNTVLFFQPCGGAVARIAPDATAFPHRRAQFNMLTAVSWPLETDGKPHISYLKNYWGGLEKYTNGYYTNETHDEGQRHIDDNYRGNIGRLTQIKKRYDPTNLFRLNANIKPTA